MLSNFFSQKSCCLKANVKKYGGARQAANINMAVRCVLDWKGYMRTHAHSLTPEGAQTHTHKYVVLIAFHGCNGFVNARKYCDMRTLPLLLKYVGEGMKIHKYPVSRQIILSDN
jgi:hypothetical protein